MDLLSALHTVTRALDEGGLPYALCGGLAVAVYGVPRATQDIDLLVLPEQLEAIVATLHAAGFRFAAAPMRFDDGMQLQRVTGIAGAEVLTVDLLLVDDNLASAFASRSQVHTEGGPLWVIGRDALIAMKVRAGRPQDLADIARLQGLDR